MSKTYTKVYTLQDARNERLQEDAAFEHRCHLRDVAQAKAKVRHWERRVKQFGGEVQQETLARMQAKLAALEESWS
jgi:hypothetical protein